MRATLAALITSVLLVPGAGQARPRGAGARAGSDLLLDGAQVRVRWIDGDTFRLLDRRGAPPARLAGCNALESYGPVHRWGNWSPRELLALADAARRVAASRTWTCRTLAREDRYHRTLVACPGAAAALVSRGLAMVYAVDGAAEATLLRRQRAAQRRRAGMWANGIPSSILTNVHSADESIAGGAYDRLVDTGTGDTRTRAHAAVYEPCQEVCAGQGSDRSCMLYVPVQRRHRDRPACLDGAPDSPRR